ELQRTGKRQFVFLDNTGVSCTNCKYNERNIFKRGEVRKHFGNYRLVQHYTDTVPATFYGAPADKDRRGHEAPAHLKFQKAIFKDERLPLYATFEVTKDKLRLVGVYEESKINDVNRFTEFLRSSSK